VEISLLEIGAPAGKKAAVKLIKSRRPSCSQDPSSLTKPMRCRLATPAGRWTGRPEQPHAAAGRTRHAEQDLDGRGLARAAAAEKP
jgi:hypothetical protein